MGGLAVLDDIRLIAPGPQAVAGGQAQRFGAPGMNDFNYWIVAHYPIGISISGPFFVRDAPNVLDPANYVLVVWDRTIGAESYDVLRTATADFPQGSGFFAVATGLTQTTARDQGQALSFYAPPAPPQSPATCRIHLNNRDYAQPTLQMPCSIAVTSIIFADGTQQSTAGGGGGGQNQTPWLSNIDGAEFALLNSGGIVITGEEASNVLGTSTGRGLVAYFAPDSGPDNAGISYIYSADFAQGDPLALGINCSDFTVTGAGDITLDSGGEGNVLITAFLGVNGQNPPQFALDVDGDINCTGTFRVNGVPIGGGASQTPWTSNIDAASFQLSNCAGIRIGSTAAIQGEVLTAVASSGFYVVGIQNTSPTGAATLNLYNNFSQNAIFGISGSSVTGDRANGAYISTQQFKLLLQVANSNAPCLWCHYAGPNDTRIGVNKLVASGVPAYTVDVVGDVNITGVYRINGVPLATGAAQTPWTSAINGAGFSLNNASAIGIGTTAPLPGFGIDSRAPMIISDPGIAISIEMGVTNNGPESLYGWIQPYLEALGAPANLVLCNVGGNVGIGTAAPSNLLSLAGASNTPSLRLGSSSGTNYFWDIGRENAFTGDFVFNNANGASIVEYMRITTAGAVGIRTSAPAYALDVAGDVNCTGNFRINGAVVALASAEAIAPLMTRIRALEDEVKHLKNTGARKHK